jgi:phosphatidate cytidylyltransferase
MLKRIIAGVVGLPILAVFVILGGLWLQFALAVIVLIGLREFYRVFSKPLKPVHYLGFVFALLHIAFLGNPEHFGLTAMTLPVFLTIFAMIFMAARHKSIDITDCAITIFGYVYVALALSTIYLLRQWGVYEVWLIFIAAWGCDTGAYAAGMTMGKHKLAPVLSPNKTIEGAIGGTALATLLGAAYGLILYHIGIMEQNFVLGYAAITFICSIFAQIGDLSASAIKRQKDVKDYGNIIPGHGGVLDRFDSIIFAAPVAFAILLIFEPFFRGVTQ